MITSEASAKRRVYNEEIVLAGETIVGSPCVAYSITIDNDSASAAVVNISDSTSYDSGEKSLKAPIAAKSVTHFSFPKGMKFSNGISAASNKGSIGVAVTYD